MDNWHLALSVGGGIIALFGFSFTVFWKIISDCKKSIESRQDRMEVRIKEIDCGADCPHIHQVSQTMSVQHQHLEREVSALRKEVADNHHSLTQRIDNLILMIRNGQNQNRS